MIALELISKDLPSLQCADKGQKAINIMELFGVSELPLVKDGDYIGLISDKDIYDLQLDECCLGEQKLSLKSPFVFDNQHVFEVINMMVELNVSIMPVLSVDRDYIGAVVRSELSNQLSSLFSVHEPGAIIALEVALNDYSLSQIAQIVESNDAKILSMYLFSPQKNNLLNVTIKINITNVSGIVQTFNRYDYYIKAIYQDDSTLKDVYSDRYEQFMKYMNL